MSVYLSNQPNPALVEVALKKERVPAILLLEMQFASGTKYTSNQNVPFIDDQWGHTWQGYGGLISISAVSGGETTLAPLMEYTLGIPWEVMTAEERVTRGAGLIPRLLGNPSEYRNRLAILREQIMSYDVLDEHGRPTPVGNPTALHTGYMDMPRASFSSSSANLTLSVEGALIRAGASVFGRYTHRDQTRRHAGDNGLRFVPEVVDTNPTWTQW